MTQAGVSPQPPSAPKRKLLAIDGGGIRGVIASRVLMRIEEILKRRCTTFTCLGDYFDFAGGTSTGSLIAVALAKGLSASEIFDIYNDRGREIFSSSFWGRVPFANQLAIRYQAAPLERVLREVLQDDNGQQLTLGSQETGGLKCYVMVVAKNATKGQTLFFVGHPGNKFYPQNKDLPLWQLARASSAAPTYFPPQPMTLRYEDATGVQRSLKTEFIDGGMSPYNNPSFQLFLEATRESYGINWARGADNLLLISIGTGFRSEVIPFEQAKSYNALKWAPYGIGVLMEGSNQQQSLLMQLISQDRSDEVEIPFEPLLTYYRYNVLLEEPSLRKLGLGYIDVKKVSKLDSVGSIAELSDIGDAIAEQQVQDSHFDGFCD